MSELHALVNVIYADFTENLKKNTLSFSMMKGWVILDLHGEELPHDLRTVPVPARDQPTPPLHYLVLQQCLYLLLKVKDSVLVCGFIVQFLWLLYTKSKLCFNPYIIYGANLVFITRG